MAKDFLSQNVVVSVRLYRCAKFSKQDILHFRASEINGKYQPHRLRHFPREFLSAHLSSGEASIVKVELAGGRASLTLMTRSEPHNRRAIHAEPEVNPARMRTGHG